MPTFLSALRSLDQELRSLARSRVTASSGGEIRRRPNISRSLRTNRMASRARSQHLKRPRSATSTPHLRRELHPRLAATRAFAHDRLAGG